MWVQSLGQENPLEEGMATHSSILAWEISWTEDPGGLWFIGMQSQTWLKRLSPPAGCHIFSSMGQASFNFMATATVHGDFGAQENKICHCFYFFLFYLPWSDGTRCHDLRFLTVEFQHSRQCWRQLFHSPLSHSSKSPFSSSSFSPIRVVFSAYLRFFIFLPAILIPACDSSSPAFHMWYSAYKLNKQADNIQPSKTPFPIWNQSIISCLVLIVASWPAYRFLRRQVRWVGISITLRMFHNLLLSTQNF